RFEPGWVHWQRRGRRTVSPASSVLGRARRARRRPAVGVRPAAADVPDRARGIAALPRDLAAHVSPQMSFWPSLCGSDAVVTLPICTALTVELSIRRPVAPPCTTTVPVTVSPV